MPKKTPFTIQLTGTSKTYTQEITLDKGRKRKLNQTPKFVFGYQLFDKVKYKREEEFVFGRRSNGWFDIRKLNGEKISSSVSYKKLKSIESRKALLVSF